MKSANFQLNSKTVGLLDAIYNSVKPLTVMDIPMTLSGSGKFESGITEIPFEFKAQKTGSYPLFETYHGVFVNIQYKITCTLNRGFFSRELKKTLEFIVHVPGQGSKYGSEEKKNVEFSMKPKNIKNLKAVRILFSQIKTSIQNVPDFTIKGTVNSVFCDIDDAFEGELSVESSSVDIKSIEIQLVRIEQCEPQILLKKKK
jgi:hypothetical protein